MLAAPFLGPTCPSAQSQVLVVTASAWHWPGVPHPYQDANLSDRPGRGARAHLLCAPLDSECGVTQCVLGH